MLTISHAIRPYHQLLKAGLLDCIQCLHRADVTPCCSANTGVSVWRSP